MKDDALASAPDATARFSVIIVNYNGGDVLQAAVNSVLRDGVLPAQIIVVDNGSVDGSDTSIENAVSGLKIHRNGYNAGFARAVNQALDRTDSEFALLLNNDAALRPGALRAFASEFDRLPTVALGGGQLRYPDGRLQAAFGPLPSLLEEAVPPSILRRLHAGRYRRRSQVSDTILVESVFGACLVVRMTALADIGKLDEDFFFYFEETDWCRRAGLRGWRVAYIPSAKADHIFGHTARRRFSAAKVEYQRSKLTYFRKSGSRARYLVVCGVLLLRSTLNAVFHLLGAVLTAFSVERIRRKTRAYWAVLAWQLLGRPRSWGLQAATRAQLRE